MKPVTKKLKVAACQTLTGIDFTLVMPTSAGPRLITVLKPDGKPATGVLVSLGATVWSADPLVEVKTDAHGQARVAADARYPGLRPDEEGLSALAMARDVEHGLAGAVQLKRRTRRPRSASHRADIWPPAPLTHRAGPSHTSTHACVWTTPGTSSP